MKVIEIRTVNLRGQALLGQSSKRLFQSSVWTMMVTVKRERVDRLKGCEETFPRGRLPLLHAGRRRL